MTMYRRNLHRNEIVEDNKDFRLIWLDANINDTDDSVQTQKMLLEVNSAAQFYTDSNLCQDLIKSIKNEEVLLIVSSDLAPSILQNIRHLRSIHAVFVLCTDHQQQNSGINEYEQPVQRFFDHDSLIESVSQTINLLEKQRMTFSLFDQKQKSSRDLSEDSASFLWHRMLLYVLQNMPQDEQSKEDMLSKCRDYYQSDPIQLTKIKEFQDQYNRQEAIKWYTADCFLYRLLNRAIRTEDMELLYSFRFFIIDLCLEIEQEYKKQKNGDDLTLYRGQIIRVEEFEKLKKNVGKIISINGFLSTSRDIKVARLFAPKDTILDDFRSILLEIKMCSSVKTAIFADVSNISLMKDEQEVLFSLNPVFEIISVDFDLDLHLWKIQLQVTDEGSENIEKYVESMKQGMDYCSPIIYFGRLLLYELDQTDAAEKYFQLLLKSLPSDHLDMASVYNWIGVIYHKRNKLNVALEYYEKAYAIRCERLPPDHPQIAASIYDLATVAEEKQDFDQAISSYKESLNMDERNYKDDRVHKAETIKRIGTIYRKKGDLNTAYKYTSRALEMIQRRLPAPHPHIAICLKNIGQIHFDQENFDEALDYFHQKLDIDERCLPSNHYYLPRDLDLIVKTYKKKGEMEIALEFCQRKLDAQKNSFGENHPRIARTLMTMSNVIVDKDPHKALQYYEEALAILEQSNPIDHETIAHCFKSMVNLCLKYNMPNDRLRCLLNALDLYRRILPSDHVYIANACRNIALCYKSMNNPSEALRYFNECLPIYQLSYEPNHELMRSIETNIARLN